MSLMKRLAAANGQGSSGASGGGFGGANLLKSVIAKKGKYRELNQLTANYKELQVKEENQAILLNLKDEKLREVEEKLVNLLGDDANPEEHATKLLLSEEANRNLRNEAASVHSANQQLKMEVMQLKKALQEVTENQTVFDREREASRKQYEELSEQLAEKQEEAVEMKERLRKQQNELEIAQSSLNQYTDVMNEKDGLFSQVATLENQLTDEKEKNHALTEQLFRNAKQASTQQNDLQNRLQATRQFLEELKLEYEEFSSVKKLEMDQYKVQQEKQYARLKRDHEQYKHRASEEMHQAQREQEDVVRALQSHFHEYRTVVENLFYTEAAALERKIEEQTMRYEQEIKFIIKAKDQHFNQMITSKDAKIMNLIEGTDLQKVLIKHQLDIEHLKAHHAKDLEMVKELALAEQQKLVNSLKKEIQEKENEIDKLMNQVLQWDKKLASTMAMNTKLRNQQKMQNEANQKIIKETQEQLNNTYQRVEELLQVKENLRHKILRLRLKLEGKSDESLDSLIKRLSKELSTLRKEWDVLGLRHQQKIDQCQRMEVSLKESTAQRGKLEKQLEQRTEEYAKLTDAFESYLNGRLRRIRGPRMAARDKDVVALMNSMSGPMVDAWYGRNEGQRREQQQAARQQASKPDGQDDDDNRNEDEDSDNEEKHQDRLALLNQVIRPVYNMRNMHQDQKSSMGHAPPDFDQLAARAEAEAAAADEDELAPTAVHTALPTTFAHVGRDGKRAPRPLQATSSSSSSSSALSARSKYRKEPPRHRMPRRLRMMSRAQELVDIESIKQLDAGYQLVKAFKERSSQYAMNLRGLHKAPPSTAPLTSVVPLPASPLSARQRGVGPRRHDISKLQATDNQALRLRQSQDEPVKKELYQFSMRTPSRPNATGKTPQSMVGNSTRVTGKTQPLLQPLTPSMLEDTIAIRLDVKQQQQQQQMSQ